MHRALLFDLDGVLVDTAKYHFLAWKALADTLDIPFTLEDNERLKGVSRMASLEIILELGKCEFSQEEKEALCTRKNGMYVDYIRRMTPEEVLPGVREFIEDAKRRGYAIALGSASKNSALVMDRVGLNPLFDAIADGTRVNKPKPDPEVFQLGARLLGVLPEDCIVFEDAAAGIRAAHAGGMAAVGIGRMDVLGEADWVIPGFENVDIATIENQLAR